MNHGRIQVAIEGQDDSYDFGSGAGFYVDATTEKWKKHYNMYTYITKVLLLHGIEVDVPQVSHLRHKYPVSNTYKYHILGTA